MSPTPEARRARHRTYVGVSLIVASFVVIAIGVQALLYQREQRDDDARDRERQACFETWGQEVIETISTRTDATADLDRAEARRDEAIDDIILVIIRLREIPPDATEQDVTRVLDRYYHVLTALREVRDDTQETREDNPYPELNC